MNGNKLYYICKYTPVELLSGYGAECVPLDYMPESFEHADEVMHPNICGFGKSVIEAVLALDIKELVLINCCDSIRTAYEVLKSMDKLDFLYFMDLTHDESACADERMRFELRALCDAYSGYSGRAFDASAFRASFKSSSLPHDDYIGILGARVGNRLYEAISSRLEQDTVNLTCINGRFLSLNSSSDDRDEIIESYAHDLMAQIPCMRMNDPSGRKKLFNDPNLKGIVYSTIKFCDYYCLEYAELSHILKLPMLKIETDYTLQSMGQLETRIDAFAESLDSLKPKTCAKPDESSDNNTVRFYVGIDSGSSSTDVVIIDSDKNIVSKTVILTGAGASVSGQLALDTALKEAGLTKEDISSSITTGYGRNTLTLGDRSITEISCHAKGAYFLDPDVRTIIDIGGQDSKVIRLGENGEVVNFTMNDKCAAGTGRFLEIMAHTLQLSPDEMSNAGLKYNEELTISNMCTVFAESEIVSLIAQDKSVNDIVHALDDSIASRIAALVKRVNPIPRFMMTGGVAKNKGVVNAIEKKLGSQIIVNENAQVCGALGAALFALESDFQ